MSWEFNEEPSCEHCGDLEPFTMTFDEDGCPWCRWCVEINGELFGYDESIMNELEEKEIDFKIKHFERRLKSLREE